MLFHTCISLEAAYDPLYRYMRYLLFPARPCRRRTSAEKGHTGVIDGGDTIADHASIAAPREGFAAHCVRVVEASELVGVIAAGLDLSANLFGAFFPVEARMGARSVSW